VVVVVVVAEVVVVVVGVEGEMEASGEVDVFVC